MKKTKEKLILANPIDYYPDVFGSDSEYNYMRRLATKTYGYVDHHYVRNTP